MFDKAGEHAIPENDPHRTQSGLLHCVEHILPGAQRLDVIGFAARLALEIVQAGAHQQPPKLAAGVGQRLERGWSLVFDITKKRPPGRSTRAVSAR